MWTTGVKGWRFVSRKSPSLLSMLLCIPYLFCSHGGVDDIQPLPGWMSSLQDRKHFCFCSQAIANRHSRVNADHCQVLLLNTVSKASTLFPNLPLSEKCLKAEVQKGGLVFAILHVYKFCLPILGKLPFLCLSTTFHS